MRILAIETSCDETAVCVMEASGTPEAPEFRVRGNALLSQAAMHAQYGGVFPNLAKREHQHNLVPMLTRALEEAALLKDGALPAERIAELAPILHREPELAERLAAFLSAHARPDVDCIAVTHGPGLEPALWVGVNLAKALAHAWQLPLVPVNHMEGHIVSALFSDDVRAAYPAIALLVSGGHTEIQEVRALSEYRLLGATRDDAAGECFDKCARLMDLAYPGGPEISRLAAEARAHKLPPTFALPRPMIDSQDFDFSFSGLKTAVLRTIQKHGTLTDDERRALSREVEDAIVDVLVKKTLRAAQEQGARLVLVGGGVSANAHLREKLTQACGDHGLAVVFPSRELSTDNAVMIAMAAYRFAYEKEYAEPEAVRAQGNLPL